MTASQTRKGRDAVAKPRSCWNSNVFHRRLDEGRGLGQYEEVEAKLARYSRQQNPKSETLYRILLATEKGISLSEIE